MQVTLVPPHFNRLSVFDGRYPHGVRAVEGTRDPLKARLVLHGWFTEPVPFFEGKPFCCSLHNADLQVARMKIFGVREGVIQGCMPAAGPLDEGAASGALEAVLDKLYVVGYRARIAALFPASTSYAATA